MGFIKQRTIYEGKGTKVYINECHAKGRKTRIFAVRRNDKYGLAHLLGLIKFNGAWRQYIFYPEANTIWSAGCKEEICKFEREMNQKWRASLSNVKEKKCQ